MIRLWPEEVRDVIDVLDELVRATRRNHALEHGAVTLLLARGDGRTRLVGRAVYDGFYIYGRVPTDLLAACAADALRRFQQGERGLAVSPLCGTNIAVAGVLAGGFATTVVGRARSVEALPQAFSAAMAGVVLAQPLGRWVQERLTTASDLDAVRIVGVRRGVGGWVHKVETAAGGGPARTGIAPTAADILHVTPS